MALHDLNLAAAYCDFVLILQNGRLVASGTPRDVMQAAMIREVYMVDCDVLVHPRGLLSLIAFSPLESDVHL